MDAVLAYDIGGTNIRAVLLSATGEKLGQLSGPTMGEDYAACKRSMVHMANQLMGKSHKLVAVGVAVAGCIKNGVLIGSGNLPGWIGHDLLTDLRTAFDTDSVVVLNDCEAAALGEYSEFEQDLIYVIWGTGVGAAVAMTLSGKLTPRATEMGHMIIDPRSTIQCGCGGYGHLEALVCRSDERRFDCSVSDITDEQWNEVLADLANGLYNMSCGDLTLPIVLGGGVAIKQLSSDGNNRLDKLQQLVNLLMGAAPAPELFTAKLGENSGIAGAGKAALQLLEA